MMQCTNTENTVSTKRVLDPCCGSRMMWFDRQHPDAVFGDKRTEQHVLCDGRTLRIEPDVTLDFTSLPYPDGTFSLVVFDPPHLHTAGQKSWMAAKYGKLSENWRDDLRKGFEECFRVLASNGTLIFKWNETQVKVREVLALTPVQPLFGHPTGRKGLTHWMVFIKPSMANGASNMRNKFPHENPNSPNTCEETYSAMLAAAPQPEPNHNWCAGCSPDNCSGCGAEPVDVEPAMWVMKHIRSGDLAQAKPDQKALHPYMWSDVFPHYTTPQPDRVTTKESYVELDIHSNPSRTEQQRKLDGSLEVGQLLGNGQNQETSHSKTVGDILLVDAFRGDAANLIESIVALVSLDRAGVLVPHGIGGHARSLLESAAIRLSQPDRTAELEAALKVESEPFGYYENGRFSVTTDGGPDKYRERKGYQGAIYATPQPDRVAELEAALKVARGALNRAADKFHDYAEIHAAKEASPENDLKVERNLMLSSDMDKALAKINEVLNDHGNIKD